MIKSTKMIFVALIFSFFIMSCTTYRMQNDGLPKEHIQSLVNSDDKKSESIHVELDEQMIFTKESQIVKDYIIGLDDVLDVSVYGESDLSKTQRVRPDGKISLPLIGDIMAYGKTPISLRNEITKKLSKYVIKTKVTVLISEYRSKKVMILGEVRAPGLLRLSANIPLLEGISLAGGVTANADLRGATLIRNGKIVPVSLYRLLKKSDMKHNVILHSNDAIFIPSNSDNKVFVLGQVNRPGIMQINDRLSILEAITGAGGITGGGKHKVVLIRGGLGDPEMFEIDIDKILAQGDLKENIYLARGDIVYVPETFMTQVNTVLANLSNILSPIVLLESGITMFPAVKTVVRTGQAPDIISTTSSTSTIIKADGSVETEHAGATTKTVTK